MRRRVTVTAAIAAVTLILTPAGTAGAATADHTHDSGPSRLAQLLGRQPLAAHDGWAADGTGTTGGSAATADHVYTVHNRAELVAALGGNNATIIKN